MKIKKKCFFVQILCYKKNPDIKYEVVKVRDFLFETKNEALYGNAHAFKGIFFPAGISHYPVRLYSFLLQFLLHIECIIFCFSGMVLGILQKLPVSCNYICHQSYHEGEKAYNNQCTCQYQ